MNIKIDHIALAVRDLERMRDFYVQCFGAKSNEGYHNTTTGLRTYFLSFENGARLEIMSWPNIPEREVNTEQFGFTHRAFQVGGHDKVDDLTGRLENAGYKILSRPRVTGDGYYESCILDPEGNQIEITG